MCRGGGVSDGHLRVFVVYIAAVPLVMQVKFLSSNAGALWFLPAYLLKIAATQNNVSY